MSTLPKPQDSMLSDDDDCDDDDMVSYCEECRLRRDDVCDGANAMV